MRCGFGKCGRGRAVIADSGHWLMEEQPARTMAAIRAFLDAK